MKIKRILPIVFILVALSGSILYSVASGRSIAVFPLMEKGQVSLNPMAIAWDGQQLWGIGFSTMGTIYQIDLQTGLSKPAFQYDRPIYSMAWNGQHFLGSSDEAVWEFTTSGQEVEHYIYPQGLISNPESLAWDPDSPGGPYLWILQEDGVLNKTRLADPLVVEESYSLLPAAAQTPMAGTRQPVEDFQTRGLVMDGLFLWVIRYANGTHELLKINAADGFVVQSFVTQIPTYSYQRGSLFFDRTSPEEPFLYMVTYGEGGGHYYKMKFSPETWQTIFIPAVYQNWGAAPTSTSTLTPTLTLTIRPAFTQTP